MGETCIPVVDLSPFLREDEDSKKKAMEVITQACSEYGFFQIVNHGLSLDLIKEALQLSKTFFDYSYEEKSKSSASSGALFPPGYNRRPPHSPDKNEFLLVFPPGSSSNVFPPNPPNFRIVLEEMFVQMSKMGVLLESIINECLGLPTNFLKEFNHDRSGDYMVAFHYFPAASKNENNGITDRQDSNCITLAIQDGVGGLQIRKNGEWIPVVPTEGAIVVNVGNIIQVLSNKKFKSATYRVVRTEGRSRYSYAFFHNIIGDKWVEPLSQFTKDIGEPPKYRGFLYKDYQELRMKNKINPPSRPEDVIQITHYAIDN
ncbi:flavonol synthase/flavanone 3-hydroxylase [Cajanus cajan]|uniref:Flavonol synthase/flavanone 3-hydroxylase n=1 Tax=Cajanus cajan TaxID=3821 RepID=A0A151RZ82_CAJCA|nr:flavonol synthase/flavanone 3-hydroxylase [Cajanus cajan]KYP47878.1 Flavonol synthase/flavanone 3-hydroxylase [Cajanus cajan]